MLSVIVLLGLYLTGVGVCTIAFAVIDKKPINASSTLDEFMWPLLFLGMLVSAPVSLGCAQIRDQLNNKSTILPKSLPLDTNTIHEEELEEFDRKLQEGVKNTWYEDNRKVYDLNIIE